MRTAVVDPETGAVVNVIVADPERDSIPGFQLVAVPDLSPVDQRWEYRNGKLLPSAELMSEMTSKRHDWNEKTGYFEPNAELRAEMVALDREMREVWEREMREAQNL